MGWGRLVCARHPGGKAPTGSCGRRMRGQGESGPVGLELEFEPRTAVNSHVLGHVAGEVSSVCAGGSHPESVQGPAYLLLLSEPQFPHFNKTKTKANVPVLRILGFLEGKQLVQGGVSSFLGFAVPPQGPEAPGNLLERSHSSQVDGRLPSLHPSR